MTDHPLVWFVATLVFIVIQGFFAMSEMSVVSFDKVRLHYLVDRGKSSAAQKLNELIKNPSRLFGTTLIAVDTALVIGSECSRRFYASLGLPPELAPVTQVAFVVIFAELVPMFAARRHSAQVALFVAPVLYACSRLFKPLILCFSFITRLINSLLKGKKGAEEQFLSREELQNIIQVRHGKVPLQDQQARIDELIGNIFRLSHTKISSIMEPIASTFCPMETMSVSELQKKLQKRFMPCFPILNEKNEVHQIAFARDLIGKDSAEPIRMCAQDAWLISEETSVLDMLKEFRSSKRPLALATNKEGKPTGLIHLQDVIEQLLPKLSGEEKAPSMGVAYERTLSCDLLLREFIKRFSVEMTADPNQTLGQYISMRLGHVPREGEVIHIDRFEMTVIEANVFSAKKISLRTLRH